MTVPTVLTQIFQSGHWVDVSQYVDMVKGITINRGREDEFAQVQPATMSLCLDNTTGVFSTLGAAAVGLPIRVSTNSLLAQNLASVQTATVETGVGDWTSVSAATLATSTTQVWQGTSSLKVTSTVATNSGARLTDPDSLYGLVVGASYRATVRVFVPSGTPVVQLQYSSSVSSSTNDQWQTLSLVFTATAGQDLLMLFLSTSIGQAFYMDGFQIEEDTGAPFVANMAPNPCLDQDATNWSVVAGTGGTAAGSRVHDQSAPSGSTWAFRGTWSAAASAGALVRATQQPGSVTPGTWSVKVWVKASVARNYQVVVNALNAAGTLITSFTSSTLPLTANTWTAFTVQNMTFPALSSRTSVDVKPTSGTAAVGETITVSALQIEPAATSSAAFRGFTTGSVRSGCRFTGYVSSFAQTWPGGRTYSQINAQSVDRAGVLARSTMRSIVDETIMSTAPNAYYNMGEPDTSRTMGDTSGMSLPSLTVGQVGSGGTLTFAQATGPGTDGYGAPQFTPASAGNGKFLVGAYATGQPVFPYIPTGGPFSFRVSFLTTSATKQTLLRFANGTAAASKCLELSVDATVPGAVRLTQGYNSVPGASPLLVTGSSYADGNTHDVVVSCTLVGAAVQVRLYVDGTLAAGPTTFSQLWAPTVLWVGGTPFGQCFNGAIAQVATYGTALSAAQATDQFNATSNGFTADNSDERIARYLGLAGVPTTAQSLEAGLLTSTAHQDTNGLTVLDAVQNVALAEGGVFFVAGDGTMTFHARSHRFSAPDRAMFDSDDVGQDTTVTMDTQGLVNFVKTSAPQGAAQVAQNASSIATYGKFSREVTLLVESDAGALDWAEWLVNANGTPAYRLPNVTVDALTASQATTDTVMNLEIGDGVTVSGLPANAPASSMALFVEGWRESIAVDEWSLLLNLSPRSAYNVLVLDDPVYGLIDSTNRVGY